MSAIWAFMYDVLGPKGLTIVTCHGSQMYVDSDRIHGGLGFYLLTRDDYENHETDLFKCLIRPGMVVVDIGANIGYYTLLAARLVGRSGRVYSFEPVPENYKLLVKSVELNGYSQVIPVQKAISNKNGTTMFFLDKESPVHPSLSVSNVLEMGGFLEVETITLDDFFLKFVGTSRVDFIKVDTQGAEGLIIEGAEKILKNNDLKILMEFWPYGLSNLGTDPFKLLQKLQDDGFKMKLMDGTEVETIRILEICEATRDGNGEVNLLLEK